MGTLRLDGLNHLDSIAERVAELEPVESGNRDAREPLDPFRLKLLSPFRQISHGIGDMSFRRQPVKPVLGADVNATVADLEPKPAPSLKRRRFLDFLKTEHATIKRTGTGFLPFGIVICT